MQKLPFFKCYPGWWIPPIDPLEAIGVISVNTCVLVVLLNGCLARIGLNERVCRTRNRNMYIQCYSHVLVTLMNHRCHSERHLLYQIYAR